MKPTTLALHSLLLLSAAAPVTAFAPPTFSSHTITTTSSSSSPTRLAYVGEDYNSVPPRFADRLARRQKPETETNDYVQRMSADERKANLEVMKKIFTKDLSQLLRARDYAGWVEAKRDLTKRQNDDPWFALNDRLKEAVQMGEDEEAARVQALIDQVGGPPPGVTHRREYAVLTEIYDTPMSLTRAEHIVRADHEKKSREIWRRRVAERKANERAEEEAARNDPMKEEREAAERRELFIKRVYDKVEASKKEALKRADDIMKDRPDLDNDMDAIERAWAVAKKQADEEEFLRNQQMLETNKDLVVSDDSIPESEKVPETSSSSSSSSSSTDEPPVPTRGPDGRPRVPGDRDVTRGEIAVDHVSEDSDVTTGHVRVASVCSYDRTASEPAARKHVFKYTVDITNTHPTRSIRLTRRRFEIQTVGSSKKDLVEGDGVTGRKPLLKPGETFKYTSLAPLNVRPLGTTIVAARMRGTYFYEIVSDDDGDEQQQQQQSSRGDGEAELGTFHFVFPEEHRVQPFVGNYDDLEDDE